MRALSILACNKARAARPLAEIARRFVSADARGTGDCSRSGEGETSGDEEDEDEDEEDEEGFDASTDDEYDEPAAT